MKDKQRICYTFLIGDLFHYGHLKLLQQAKEVSDYHICGVVSDEAVKKWQSPMIANYDERKAVIENLICVDEVIRQDSLDPTENLRLINKKFPESHLILFRSHYKWGQSAGMDYIKEINGEIIHPEYYPGLSRDFIAKSFYETIVSNQKPSSLIYGEEKSPSVQLSDDKLSTKADTLLNIKPILQKSIIEETFVFTVSEWRKNKNSVLSKIKDKFRKRKIVVRSSSQSEDLLEFSSAGLYRSKLNVESNDLLQVKEAIIYVIEGYLEKEDTSGQNQILIQQQTEEVNISGVVFTRNLETNTPYYLINYDDSSNKTDTVTSGLVNKKIEILKTTNSKMIPSKWKNLIEAVKEIENSFSGVVLDIEFAVQKSGEVVIFQVRPLAANSKFYNLNDEPIFNRVMSCQDQYLEVINDNSLLTSEVYLSDMAFWNPAELIGNNPSYLAYSLFNNLIMKNSWNEGLISLGYTKVDDGLMASIALKPYVNVHNAFLSLLPSDLSEKMKIKLLEFYNSKLKSNPELHDKIEFEVVHNCYTFTFESNSDELKDNGFSIEEIKELKKSLLSLTNSILVNYNKIIKSDMADIKELEIRRKKSLNLFESKNNWESALSTAYDLIQDCKKLSTEQFSRIARLAFIAKSLLNSVKELDAINEEDYNLFMSSITTVATEMNNDFDLLNSNKLSMNEFLKRYGHLRPGTYDITKVPYYKNKEYFSFSNRNESANGLDSQVQKSEIESLTFRDIENKITKLCTIHNFTVDGIEILNFVRSTIKLREFIKFEFTKNLSEALEMVAYAGEELGFSREQMSYLDLNTLILARQNDLCSKNEMLNIWQNMISARTEEKRLNDLVSTPPLIFSEKDFIVVPSYVSKPNFVTQSSTISEIIVLEKSDSETIPVIENKIVVLENADPGYDWIFTKNIKGLVTKYGGAASHMTIRCAEFKIPAAIGCGDVLFEKVCNSDRISLDCKNKKIDTFKI